MVWSNKDILGSEILRSHFMHSSALGSRKRRYMEFIFSHLKQRNPNGSLQIMYSFHGICSTVLAFRELIHHPRRKGEKDIKEIELDHLEGYKCSKPVRCEAWCLSEKDLISSLDLELKWGVKPHSDGTLHQR